MPDPELSVLHAVFCFILITPQVGLIIHCILGKENDAQKLSSVLNGTQYVESLKFELRSSASQSLLSLVSTQIRLQFMGKVRSWLELEKFQADLCKWVGGRQEGNNMSRCREVDWPAGSSKNWDFLDLDQNWTDWQEASFDGHENQAEEPDPLRQEGQAAHSSRGSPYI